jgi:hypothetical protein
MFEPAFGYLSIPMLPCQVVVVFVAFSVAMLDGSIFGVMHTPATPKFEFLRTFSNHAKKKNVLEFIQFL